MQTGVCLYATAEETGLFLPKQPCMPFVWLSVTDTSDSWRQ